MKKKNINFNSISLSFKIQTLWIHFSTWNSFKPYYIMFLKCFFFRYEIKHIFKKELFLIMLWDLMCNISTDGTSINELEISTGQHTLDKGTTLLFRLVCTHKKSHFTTSLWWRALYNETEKYLNVESKIFGFFSFQNDSVW